MPGPKSFESCGMDLRHHFLEWSITAPELERLPKDPLLNSGKSPVFVCDDKAIKRTHLASALLNHIPQLTGLHFCRHTYVWLSYGPTPVVHCWNCSPQDSRGATDPTLPSAPAAPPTTSVVSLMSGSAILGRDTVGWDLGLSEGWLL